MYPTLLTIHSYVRWLVLAGLLYTLVRAYIGWLGAKQYTKGDGTVRTMTVTFVHIQFLLGLGLYFVSPFVQAFLNNFSELVHDRGSRFYGMEHSVAMLIAVVLLTIGSARTRRKATDLEKFKCTALWFTIALVIMLASIPWPFMVPYGRAYFRGL